MNAFRALGRGIVPESESAWLFKIAENVCLSRRRSSWRRGRIESPSDFEIIEEIVPGPSRQNDELIGIEGALASMPPQQRRAIVLREWQGLSYREIAQELEVSQSAVETLIFRARRSLATGLEQPHDVRKPRRRSFRRIRQAFDVGTVATVFKALLAGSVAVKATTAAVAVTAAGSAYGVERIESKPAVRAGAPAMTEIDKPAPPTATSALSSSPAGSVRAAAASTPEHVLEPVAASKVGLGLKPAGTVVVKQSAPLLAIPAERTPVRAPPAPVSADTVSAQVSPSAAQPTEAPRGNEGTDESGKPVEPGSDADEAVVAPAPEPASVTPAKAEPVAATPTGTVVPTPAPADATNPAPVAPTSPTTVDPPPDSGDS